ncbi:MAG: hypothetical protein MZV49_12955 [Rhodopseudomonas palustris]|nr:hypothetical protein [Rhodopseudomonas palustris]
MKVDHREIRRWGNPIIGPDVGRLKIRYTALSFSWPEDVRFRYRIVGYDRDWIDAGGDRIARYSGIPPGVHRFEVMACNESGVWSQSADHFEFTMNPRFSQTIWFYVLATVWILLFILLVFRYRIRQIRKRQRILEDLVESRTRESGYGEEQCSTGQDRGGTAEDNGGRCQPHENRASPHRRSRHEEPLQSILGYSELIEMENQRNQGDTGEMARLINEAVVRMLRRSTIC